MDLKSIKQHCSFFALSLLFCSQVFTADDALNFDSFDLPEIQNNDFTQNRSDDEFNNLIENINDADLSTLRSCSPGNANDWLTVFSLFGLVPILNEPIYKATSIPISRNLIHYPTMELCTYTDLSNRQFTGHFLINKTTYKAYRTSTEDEVGTRLGSYINIENQSILTVLDEILSGPLITDQSIRDKFKALDMRALTRAFGNARFEERRLAFMGHYYREMGKDWYFEVKMPLLWVIRNLNYDQVDKDFIDKQAAILSPTGTFNEERFADNHLIMDALGTGTMEVVVSKKAYEQHNWSFDLSVGLLLPTDYAFATGLRGTYLTPVTRPPVLSFCDLVDLTDPFNLVVQPGALSTIGNFFLGALDQLNSIILECPLGYNNHLGIELKMTPFWQVRPNFEFNGVYIFEWFLPHQQQRFYVPRDLQLFTDEYNSLPQETNAEQDAKLDFVEARITELFYPLPIDTTISPGWIFTSVSSFCKKYYSWNFVCGYSGWYKSGERILDFPTLTPEKLRALHLDLQKSVNPDVYSVKLFGKINKLVQTKRHDDFSLSLWGDVTIFNSGVGNDYTLGFCFDSKF